MATAPTVSLQLVPTPSGILDLRYPDGDDGAGISWDAPQDWPDLTLITVNTSFTTSIALLLNGGGSPTITVHPSDTLPTGFAFDGTNLTQSGTTPGSGQVRFQADDGSNVITSHYVQITSLAAGTTDDVAPSRILGLRVSLNASNQPVITIDPPSDPWVSGKDSSGLDDVRVVRDTTDLTDQAWPDAGLSPQFTGVDIGTMSPAGASTQSGADWQLTGEGQISGSSDVLRLVYNTHAGNGAMVTEVESFSGSTENFAKAGIMARVSTDPDAAFVFLRIHQSREVRLEYRSAAGASRVTIGSGQASAFPVQLKLVRSGTTWTGYYSEDGKLDKIVGTLELGLPSSLLWGMVATSTDDGVSSVIEYNDTAMTFVDPITVTDTGAGTGVTRTYKATAFDQQGNESADSYSVSIDIPASSPAAAIRFHPGHYSLISDDGTGTVSAHLATLLTKAEVANTSARYRGILFRVGFGHICNGPADYNWTIPDAMFSWAATNSKYLIFQLVYKHFGTGNEPAIAPADMQSEIVSILPNGQTIGIWREPVMTRYIETYRAFRDRYNSNPWLEGFFNTESPLSNPQAADYHVLTYSAQLQRLQDALAEPRNFNTALCINSLGQQQAALLMERSYQLGIGQASPDARYSATGFPIWDGTGTSTQSGTPVRDYRQSMAHMSLMSYSSLALDKGHDTLLDAFTFVDDMDLTHVAWYQHGTVSSTGDDVSEDAISDEIESRTAHEPVWETCPTVYPSCST